MNIAAIDPGDEQSAWVVYDTEESLPKDWDFNSNEDLRDTLEFARFPVEVDRLVIEYTPPYTLQLQTGRPFMPNQVVRTAFESGRMVQSWGGEFELLSRIDIKKHLLGRATGNDADIKQALYDRYGGTREKAVGLKKTPGPLHGIYKHVWSALAVAVAWSELKKIDERAAQPF